VLSLENGRRRSLLPSAGFNACRAKRFLPKKEHTQFEQEGEISALIHLLRPGGWHGELHQLRAVSGGAVNKMSFSFIGVDEKNRKHGPGGFCYE